MSLTPKDMNDEAPICHFHKCRNIWFVNDWYCPKCLEKMENEEKGGGK